MLPQTDTHKRRFAEDFYYSIQFQAINHFFDFAGFQVFFAFATNGKQINRFCFSVEIRDHSGTAAFTFLFAGGDGETDFIATVGYKSACLGVLYNFSNKSGIFIFL
jgi:hypothetical protein